MRTLIMLLVLVTAACVSPPPGEPTCEEARAEAFEMKPPFACRIVGWPSSYTMYPLPVGDGTPGEPNGTSGTTLIPVGDGTADMYAGPAQYNEILRQPGVLAATPDGNCAWLRCDGGVSPIDAGTR